MLTAVNRRRLRERAFRLRPNVKSLRMNCLEDTFLDES